MIAVSRETSRRLELLEALVRTEAESQNLVAASTLASFYDRHIADSLQLLELLAPGPVVDIGSGAGFPGLVIAIAGGHEVNLVEPRAKRASFLMQTIDRLEITNATVSACKVERLDPAPTTNITARAVMGLGAIFAAAIHIADRRTRWVLPKGRSAKSELADARRSWQGRFEVIPSRTDPEAAIIVATDVRRV